MKTTDHAMHRIHKLDQYQAEIARLEGIIKSAEDELTTLRGQVDTIRGLYSSLQALHETLLFVETLDQQLDQGAKS